MSSDGLVVYCSGPMFAPGDLSTQNLIASTLEKVGYQTYLPQRDGIEVAKVMSMVNRPIVDIILARDVVGLTRKAIFALDMYQLLSRCGAVVFTANGRTPDDGSVVETAAAFAAGKPIVIYKEDPRSELNGQDNPMVTGLSYTFKYVETVDGIPAALESILKKFPWSAGPIYTRNMPLTIQQLVAAGAQVWQIMQEIHFYEKKQENFWKLLVHLVEHIRKYDVIIKYFEAWS